MTSPGKTAGTNVEFPDSLRQGAARVKPRPVDVIGKSAVQALRASWNENCLSLSGGGSSEKGELMLLLIVLIILLLAVFPAWPYSRGWGYYPSGGLGLILVIFIIMLLLGYFHF